MEIENQPNLILKNDDLLPTLSVLKIVPTVNKVQKLLKEPTKILLVPSSVDYFYPLYTWRQKLLKLSYQWCRRLFSCSWLFWFRRRLAVNEFTVIFDMGSGHFYLA